RHHADDVGLDTVEPNRLADDLRIAAEAPPPEGVADDDDRRRAAVAIFPGSEDAATNGADAEHVPHRRREAHALDAFGGRAVFGAAKVAGKTPGRPDRLERTRLLFPRQVVLRGRTVAHRRTIDEG